MSELASDQSADILCLPVAECQYADFESLIRTSLPKEHMISSRSKIFLITDHLLEWLLSDVGDH